jgi:hypothetical protein
MHKTELLSGASENNRQEYLALQKKADKELSVFCSRSNQSFRELTQTIETGT